MRLLFFVLALAAAGTASAQYPAKPVRLVISVTAGAGVDLVARLLAERLGHSLGQPFVAENRAGASSMIAASQVAGAPADGYTLLFAPNTLLIAPHVLAKGAAGGVDVIRDLVPVVKVASSPLVFTAHPSLGVKTIHEFIALAKRQPGMTYATTGSGTPFHIAGELFQRSTGVKLTHVPYRGLAQAVTDAVSGQVDTMFATPGGALTQLIATGKAVALAVAERRRSPLLPNVPTLTESSIADVEMEVWFLMFAPAATPPAILARLNQEISAVMRAPEVRERLAGLGIDALGGSTLEEVGRDVRDAYRRYGRIVAEFGIKE